MVRKPPLYLQTIRKLEERGILFRLGNSSLAGMLMISAYVPDEWWEMEFGGDSAPRIDFNIHRYDGVIRGKKDLDALFEEMDKTWTDYDPMAMISSHSSRKLSPLTKLFLEFHKRCISFRTDYIQDTIHILAYPFPMEIWCVQYHPEKGKIEFKIYRSEGYEFSGKKKMEAFFREYDRKTGFSGKGQDRNSSRQGKLPTR